MMVLRLFPEPSSAFDPDREMKDRKLVQIFKKLHMEQDLNTLLDFDETVPRPSKVALNHTDELSTDKVERCRPRKILDYAVLAKGQGYRNNLVGSFSSNYSETGGSNKSGSGCKRIRFQKDQFDDNVPTFGVKRRSRCGRYASVTKKNSKLRRFSFPAANGARKKEASRSRSFTGGTKGGILKRHVKDADNIKQAFLISKKVLNTQNQNFKEFALPEKWIKESQKRKKVKKMKSGEEGTSSASVEDLAMERLVRAFKTAKLLYPEKFAEYFPDFMQCFEPDDSKRKRGNKNGVASKQTHLKIIKSEDDCVTSDKNIASDSGDDLPKRIRKMPKILREYSTSAETVGKKLSSLKEQVPSVTQKFPRIDGPLAGTSGLRKRSKTSIDSPSNQSILSKSQQDGKVESTKEVGDSEGMDRVSASKRRRRIKSALRPSSSFVKATSVNAIIQNNIEDSATESSSDESGNMRSSKRQRAQSGFYK
uniref:[Histone H3]-lysine(79) N-trimethyltransferase n=1 Tax=Elaeophora elaphi TaxID=1147741 RepID=A0A0R3RGQ4_9BILA